MKIQKFSFSHHRENWHIDEVSFDDFNLLVGPSGVGKTRILVALETIFGVALSREKLDDFEWTIHFSHLDKSYIWSFKSAIPNDKDIFEIDEKEFEVIEEKLIQFEIENEIEIFYIASLISKFNGIKLPKIKKTESAISLFPEEDLITPLVQGFERFLSNKLLSQSVQLENIDSVSQQIELWSKKINLNQENIESIAREFKNNAQNINSKKINDSKKSIAFSMDLENFIKQKMVDFSPVVKALILFTFQETSPTESKLSLLNSLNFFKCGFDDFKRYYLNIFPEIKDLKVYIEDNSDKTAFIFFKIQDANSDEWIPQDRMSSGMFRTLMYIIEVITAPKGSVILIDEFENSLGINCMSEITDFILDHADGLQFIITSHHPYIINNIPWQDWQIVSRKGSHIKTQKATEISALKTASSLDKFTQLINVLDFEEMEA